MTRYRKSRSLWQFLYQLGHIAKVTGYVSLLVILAFVAGAAWFYFGLTDEAGRQAMQAQVMASPVVRLYTDMHLMDSLQVISGDIQ